MSDYSIIFTPAFCVFIVILFLIYIFVGRKEPYGTLPPGPTPYPVVGNSLSLWGRDLRQVFKEYRRTYGDIFTVHVFNRTMVVVNGYEMIKDIFVKRGNEFSDRSYSHISFGEGIVYSSGEIWKCNRRFAMQTLKDFGMGKSKLQTKIHEEVTFFLDAIDEYHGTPFNIKALLYMTVSNVICSIIFGRRFEYTDEKFLDYMRRTEEIVKAGLARKPPWLKHIPFDLCGVRKILRHYEHIFNFHRTEIREHLDSFDEKDTRDLIDAYIKQMVAEDNTDVPRQFNEDNLVRIIVDLFIAGTDTTSTALLFGLIYLVKNPDIQIKLREELNRVVPNSRFPDVNDKRNLPLMRATMSEILRRASIAPISVPHTTPVDREYHGYTIPKSAIVAANLDSVLMDETLWKEPQEFTPSRFLNEDMSLIKKEELIPFSLGPRMCPGESLARMEMFLLISAMLQRFELLPPEGEDPPSTDSIFGGVCSPVPFKIRAVKIKLGP